MRKKIVFRRILSILAVFIFQLTLYKFVNYIGGLRSPDSFVNLNIIIDKWIPYLNWTWIFYYSYYAYFVIVAILIIIHLQRKQFTRTIFTFMITIFLGASIELLVPAHCPWPENMGIVQEFMHHLTHTGAYACFPSMHVVLVLLLSYVSLFVIQSRFLRIFSVLFATLITISTLTMKEHYILDVLSGILLAYLGAVGWRGSFRLFLKGARTYKEGK